MKTRQALDDAERRISNAKNVDNVSLKLVLELPQPDIYSALLTLDGRTLRRGDSGIGFSEALKELAMLIRLTPND